MKKKIYGEDLRFVRIYELIKMRALISVEDRNYFLSEKKNYGELLPNREVLGK